MSESTEIIRNPDGTFPKGVSGNPNGRPKGRKNHLTELKQDMEIALRENLSDKDIKKVIRAMLNAALEGNVGAGKLILDKVLSNAKEADDEREQGGALRVIIENATIESLQQSTNLIESKPEEIENG